MSYSNGTDIGAVALDAVTPVKLTSVRTTGSQGIRVPNPSPTLKIYIRTQAPGTTAPTFAEMSAGKRDYTVQPEATQDDFSRGLDVYACVSGGTLTIYPRELF